ncbi:MAG TPA: hypothetical protein VG963_05885 [Polyangiaceae bacterium]|nr:hypothetical protein [Polyangiaceae bacterium]
MVAYMGRRQILRGLPLWVALSACDNSGLVNWRDTSCGGAGQGSAGSDSNLSAAGDGGAAGTADSGAVGTNPDQAGICPDDDGSAAAFTLAGLGLSLPDQQLDAGMADAGSTATGDAGGAGAATPDPTVLEFAGLALPSLVGWAAQPGLGTATTIGGAAGPVVTAHDADELIDFASRPEPLVIRVCGTLRVPQLRVSSHKTLLGAGSAATLEGGISIGGGTDYVRNVVIANLRVNAAFSNVSLEAIRIDHAHHVWLDHAELFDAAGDGALDVINGSDFVSVSWTKFHFTANTPDSEHRFAFRIGDNNLPDDVAIAQDRGHLNVTLHHDWFADDVRQRAPRARFGNVHVYDTYYTVSSTPDDWLVWASTESRVFLENDYFLRVNNPHELNTPDAQLLAIGNIYDGATGSMQSTNGAFVPPYSYTADPALDVPALVMQGIGPH